MVAPSVAARNGASARGDHRQSAGHGLEDDKPERLLGPSVHKGVGRGKPLCKLDAVAAVRHERDIRHGTRFALPANHQEVVRMPEARKRLQQYRQILFLGEPSCINEYPSVRRQTQARAQIKRIARGAKNLSVHAERLMHGVPHTQIV